MFRVRHLRFLLLLIFCQFAYAHPHSYIDLKATWLVEQNKLIGIDFQWRLDEMTSLSLTYDIFQKMPYSAAMQKIANDLTYNMQEVNYFTHLTQENKPLTFHVKPNSSHAEQEKLTTAFYFTLLLDTPVPLTQTTLHLTTYESSYYVSMSYENVVDIDVSNLPEHCQTELLTPNYEQLVKNYLQMFEQDDASKYEPDLGNQFAQQVVLTCP